MSSSEKTKLLSSSSKTKRHPSKSESEPDNSSGIQQFWNGLSGATKVLVGGITFCLSLFILSYFIDLKSGLAGDIAKYKLVEQNVYDNFYQGNCDLELQLQFFYLLNANRLWYHGSRQMKEVLSICLSF